MPYPTRRIVNPVPAVDSCINSRFLAFPSTQNCKFIGNFFEKNRRFDVSFRAQQSNATCSGATPELSWGSDTFLFEKLDWGSRTGNSLGRYSAPCSHPRVIGRSVLSTL